MSDANTITNRLAADLPYALSASEGALISPMALDNPDLDVKPVGSGPYVATDVQLSNSMTLKRREVWFGFKLNTPFR